MGNFFHHKPSEWSVRRPRTWDDVVNVLTRKGGASRSIGERWVALQFSRQLAPSKDALVECLRRSLVVERNSVLMRHEIAFTLGQTETKAALKTLKEILIDDSEDEVTRHEAAESIALIDSRPFEQLLSTFARDRDRHPILADTSMLALEGLRQYREQGEDAEDAPFVPSAICGCTQSIDLSKTETSESRSGASLASLSRTLVNAEKTLYERYAALFELRDCHRSEAPDILAYALRQDRTSALLRHELAFTLGLFGDPKSMRVLIDTLKNSKEHDVVRHEAAISLGSIDVEEAHRTLLRHARSRPAMVRESCIAALAMRPFTTGKSALSDDAFEFKWGGVGEESAAKGD